MPILNELGSKLLSEHKCFMFIHLSDIKNASAAVIISGLADDEACLDYISTLYNVHNPIVSTGAAGPSRLLGDTIL